MAIMSRDMVNELNNKMLGLGAPVVIDGQGYNKPDYVNMIDFSKKDFNSLTDRQIWFVAITLGKYKNTQLTAYKVDLEETIAHYSTNPSRKPLVKVVSANSQQISVQFPYNKDMSQALKTELDKTQYRWIKDGNEWTLNIKWDYVPTLVKEFGAKGYDTQLLEDSYKSRTPSTKASTKSVSNLKLEVTRSASSIDTLTIRFIGFDSVVVTAIKAVKGIFDGKNKVWEFPIEESYNLYKVLPDTVNKESLKKWADLVKGWETSHQLVDPSKYNLKFKPYNFQPQDAQKLLQLKVGLNGNEVGCGKTFEMILVGESIPMKKLVICPATLRLNWEREIHMVNPSAQVHIQYSDKPFEVVDGWNIIGYPSLTKFQEQLEQEQFQVIMADEAHYIQAVDNYGKPNSQRAKAVLRISATAQYVFPITGTPKTNRNLNLYNILRMMRHPLTRGKYAFSDYGKHFCAAQSTPWGMDYSGNSHDKELSEILAPLMVRHLKKDVLPHLQKQRQAIPVSVNLAKYYQAIDEYMLARKNKNAEALVALTRAKQVVAIQKVKHTIEFAKEIIEQGEKVVITTSFTEVVTQIQKAIPNCLKLVGGMSDKTKQATIDEFQNGDIQVIVLNYEAGGVGITLTAASTMIMNDLPWQTGHVDQAEGRIWRGGQTKTAMIYYMTAVGCPMDEKLVDMIVAKSQTINAVVDQGLGEDIDLRKLAEQAI